MDQATMSPQSPKALPPGVGPTPFSGGLKWSQVISPPAAPGRICTVLWRMCLLACIWLMASPVQAETAPPPPRIFHAKENAPAKRRSPVKRAKKRRTTKKKRTRKRVSKRSKRRSVLAKIPAGSPMWRHLRRLGPGVYTMTPQAHRYYLQQLSYVKLKVLVELLQHRGRAVGFSLLYVSPSSPLRRIGLRQKDVLVSVNGMPLRSTFQAMLAYMSLKQASRYTVRLLRRNKPYTLVVQVQ